MIICQLEAIYFHVPKFLRVPTIQHDIDCQLLLSYGILMNLWLIIVAALIPMMVSAWKCAYPRFPPAMGWAHRKDCSKRLKSLVTRDELPLYERQVCDGQFVHTLRWRRIIHNITRFWELYAAIRCTGSVLGMDRRSNSLSNRPANHFFRFITGLQCCPLAPFA